MKKGSRSFGSLYVRNIIFGIEDSLVSTVGLLSGIASASATHSAIILTGVIYIIVEAFSMAMGSFLSEEFAEEYEAKGPVAIGRSFGGAVAMFISFAVAGVVPLLPYMIAPNSVAFPVSVVASIAALFLVGAINGRYSKTGVGRDGLRMALIGGFAIVLGILVGHFLGVA